MSFVIGCKHREHVFLIADTAITNARLRKPATHTSFGELECSQPSIQEGMLKLLNLGTMAVGVTGDVIGAARIVDRIKIELTARGPEAALQRAIAHTGPLDRAHAVGLICAWPSHLGATLVAAEPGKDCAGLREGHCVSSGSLSSAHVDKLTSDMAEVLSMSLTIDEKLVAMLATIQNYTLHNYLMEQENVGGTFAGIAISSNGIQWQKNLAFLFHDGDSIESSGVVTRVIDNALVVTSGLTRVRTIMTAECMTASVREWFSHNKATLEENLEADYLIFQSTRYPKVVIQPNPEHNRTASRQNGAKLFFSGGIREELSNAPPTGRTDLVWFQNDAPRQGAPLTPTSLTAAPNASLRTARSLP